MLIIIKVAANSKDSEMQMQAINTSFLVVGKSELREESSSLLNHITVIPFTRSLVLFFFLKLHLR
jgi:hypothetical protein